MQRPPSITSNETLINYLKSIENRVSQVETKGTGTIGFIDEATGVETIIGNLPDGSVGLQEWINDTTPPEQPSAPVVTAGVGFLRVAWDGLDVLDGLPPKDYNKTVVEKSANGINGWTAVDELRGNSSANIGGVSIDVPTYFRLISLDKNNNASVPSATASGTALYETPETTQAIAEAIQSAQNANNLASSKIKVYFQAASPALTGNTFGDTWFDTDEGNKVYVWTGSAWTSAQDTKIPAIETLASSKIKSYVQSTSPALTGNTFGDTWYDTSQGNKIYVWTGSAWTNAQDAKIPAIETLASSKIKVYSQSSSPALTGNTYGDTWYNTSQGNKVYIWNGSAWTSAQDTAVVSASALASSKTKTYYQSTSPATTGNTVGDTWFDTGNGNRISVWNGSVWSNAQDAAVVSASALASSKIKVYSQSTSPALTGNTFGDTWYDTANGNKIYIWNGSAWSSAQDASIAAAQTVASSKTKTYFQSTSPALTGNTVGDTWYDTANGNRVYVWNGSAWTNAQDAAIAAAQATANTKTKTYFQTSSPSLTGNTFGDTWFDTSNGNKPYVWTGSAWTNAQDAAIVSASSLASSKMRSYYQSTSPALTGNTIGDAWYNTADGNKIYVWNGSSWASAQDAKIPAIETLASSKIKVYSQSTSPALTGNTFGDTWYDTANGNKIYIWNGSAWSSAQDASIAAAQTTANTKTKTYFQTASPALTGNVVGDTWFDTDDGNRIYVWNGSAWANAQDATIATAQGTANTALTSANGKNKVYYQTAMPTGGTYILGDTWFDTDDGNKIYVHNGTTFVSAQDTAIGTAQSTANTALSNAATADGKAVTATNIANSKNVILSSASAPTSTGRVTGDTWFDTSNGNKPSIWNGSAWVSAQDASIATAQGQANTALTTANGKTKTFITGTQPTATTVGDIWIDTANGNVIKTWEGSAWITRADAAIAAAQGTANTAVTNAATADGKAVTATNIANSKNVILSAASAPTSTGRVTGDTWFDTANGNKPYVWTGSAWSTVQDASIATAQGQANTALTTANGKTKTFIQGTAPTATTVGDIWIDTANGNVIKTWEGSSWVTRADAAIATAQGTANTAVTNAATADGKAVTATNIANSKNVILSAASAPTSTGRVTGDTWFDTSNGNKPSIWNGSAWVSVQDATIATAQGTANNALTTANGKNKTYFQTASPALTGNTNGDIWFDTDDGNKVYVWNGSSWASARDSEISAALTSANGKNKVYYQTAMPTGGTYILGDTWFDTDDGNKIYVHNGTTFVVAQDSAIAAAQTTANTKTKTYFQTASPALTGNTTGDIWFDTDDGNKVYVWNGSAWTNAQDATIATAQGTANTALTSANGKNKIYYQTTMPSGGTYIAGDTWFDTDDGNKIYVHNGTTFTASQLGSNAIANLAITNAQIADTTIQSAKIAALDAAKITSGTIDANRIGANTIAANKIIVGDFTNLASDGNFQDTAKLNWIGSGTVTVSAGESNRLMIVTAASGNNDQSNRNIFQVSEGEQLYGEMWVYGAPTNVGGGGPNLHLAVSKLDGTTVWPTFQTLTRAAVSGQWVKLSGSVTMPAGVKSAKVEPAISFSADAVGNTYYFRDIVVRRKATGNLIVDGAIQAGSAIIGTGAIGSAQIADLAVGTAEIADAAVTNAKILDLAVTNAKIANATIDDAKIANLNAGKITAGTLDAARIGADTITGGHIAGGTITAAELAAGSVTASAIAANSITATALAANSITATAIGADTITAGNIAVGAITSSELSANSVTASAIKAGEVDATHLKANSITATAIGAGAISATAIAADSITAGQIASGAVTAAELAAGSVTASAIAANSITATALAAQSISATAIAADTITSGNIAAGAITSSELSAGSVSASALAANSITATALAANSITATAIAASAIKAGSAIIENGAISSAQIGSLDAAKITSGTIDALRIGAGTITATALSVTMGGNNLVANSSFEADTNGDGLADSWQVWTRGAGDAGRVFTNTRPAGLFPGSTYAQRVTSTTVTNTEQSSIQGTQLFAIAPGDKATLSLYGRASVAGNFSISLRCEDDGGVYKGDAQFTAAFTTTTQRFSGLVVIPAGTTRAKVTVTTPLSLTSGHWFEVDGIKAELGDVLSAWSPLATELLPGTIVANMLSANSVLASSVKAGEISAVHLAANSITASALAAGSITATAIGSQSITATALAASSITATAIAAQTITASALASGSITATALGAQSVTATAIKSNTITATQLAANSITATAIAAGAISASALAAQSITATALAAGSITATAIAANSITATALAAQSITATAIAGQTITAAQLAANSVTATAIGAQQVTSSKLMITDMEEFVPNPYFHPNGEPVTMGTIVTAASTPVSAGAPFTYVYQMSTRDNHPFNNTPNIPVKDGDQFYLEVYVATSTAIRNFNLYMFGSTVPVGGLTAKTSVGNVAPTTTWTKVTWDYTVPTGGGYSYIKPVLQVNTIGGETAAQVAWYATGFTMRRKNTGSLIVDGSITASKIAANSITATALAADSITATAIAANAVTAQELAAGSITATAIAANAITASALAAGSITATALAANSITATAIGAQSITATALAAGSITATAIAAGSITASALAAQSITATALGAQSVSATAIAAQSITATALAAQSITATALAAQSITASALAAGSITATAIAADSITATAIAANAVTATELAANSITATAIAAGSITASALAAQSITATAMGAQSITATAIGAGSITATALAAQSITATALAAQSITASAIAAGSITATAMAANSISATAIAAKSITADKLVITSTANLVVEGDFGNAGKSWQLGANNTINATAGRGSLPAMRFTGVTSQVTSTNLINKVSVGTEDRFRGALWLNNTVALAAGAVQLKAKCYTTATTVVSDVVIASSPAITSTGTYVNVLGISTALPTGTIALEFYLSVTNPTTGAITDIDYVSVTRAADASLVVDGAIDGKLITGATVQTAASGARVIMDTNGLRAFNTSGTQYLTADATGLTMLGTVVAQGLTDGAPGTEVPLKAIVGNEQVGSFGVNQAGLHFRLNSRASTSIVPRVTSPDGLSLQLTSGVPDGSGSLVESYANLTNTQFYINSPQTLIRAGTNTCQIAVGNPSAAPYDTITVSALDGFYVNGSRVGGIEVITPIAPSGWAVTGMVTKELADSSKSRVTVALTCRAVTARGTFNAGTYYSLGMVLPSSVQVAGGEQAYGHTIVVGGGMFADAVSFINPADGSISIRLMTTAAFAANAQFSVNHSYLI